MDSREFGACGVSKLALRPANCDFSRREPSFGTPHAQRGVEKAASRAGLGTITPHDLRRSFRSLAGRRGVDPVEAAQITGHSPAVWARFYARSFGKAQRDEARDLLLEYGFGALSDEQVTGPLAPRSHRTPFADELPREGESETLEAPANEEVP